MIKAIIFDFDGVILDSVNVKTDAFAKMFSSYGSEVVEKVVQHHKQHGGISRFVKIKHYYNEYLNREIDENELEKLCYEFSKLVYDGVINSPWIEGAKEFLVENHKSYKFFIATGTPQDEIINITFDLNIAQYFCGIYGSPRKKEELIQLIINKNQLHKEEILFIGDALTDYEAAKYYSIKFIGISSSNITFSNDVLVFRNFIEISKWLPTQC